MGKKSDEYGKLCGKTLKSGIICSFPVILVSGSLYFLLGFLRIYDSHPLIYKFLSKFIVLALAEESVKYLTFKRILKKNSYPYSWIMYTILMLIVGLGFSIPENLVFAIGAAVPEIIVRGICVPHSGYGYIVGYFCGKSIKEGKLYYRYIGFIIAWVLHGLYDFGLSEELIAINDNLSLISFLLAVVNIVLWISLVIFSVRASKKEAYTEPLVESLL